jgi:hypothetical protein
MEQNTWHVTLKQMFMVITEIGVGKQYIVVTKFRANPCRIFYAIFGNPHTMNIHAS